MDHDISLKENIRLNEICEKIVKQCDSVVEATPCYQLSDGRKRPVLVIETLELNPTDSFESFTQGIDVKVFQMKGAKLIVLPEYGIYGPAKLGGLNKIKLTPYLEYIPDPRTLSWNPCNNPNLFPDTDVQRFLSCLSKNNSIYIVANYGDKQPCSQTKVPDCPPTGHFQYNTDIVYDPEGNFIAKYHKFNLFFEYHFDTPKQAEITTFETPFGTFGVFTCFDILFHNPAIEMIEKHGIKNIVFPTAWIDEAPFFTSVEFHSAFAIGWGINFLSSNLHYPPHGFHGSGIYTPSGIAAYYYNDKSKEGRLLVADIPVIDNVTYKHYPFKVENKEPRHDLTLLTNAPPQFQVRLFHDLFNLVHLKQLSDKITVCHNQLCCHLSYNRSRDDEVFAFGAFDGLHTHNRPYYLQICTLLKCPDSSYDSCSLVDTYSMTNFHEFQINGNFSKPYIYPEILLSRNGSLALSTTQRWQFKKGILTNNSTLEYPLLSATLFSRIYNRDNEMVEQKQLQNPIIG